MIPEIDVWRSAQEMIRQYGEDAVHQADAHATALTEQGDSVGGAVWRRIREAIGQLQNDTPNGPLTRQRNRMSRHLPFGCDAIIYCG